MPRVWRKTRPGLSGLIGQANPPRSSSDLPLARGVSRTRYIALIERELPSCADTAPEACQATFALAGDSSVPDPKGPARIEEVVVNRRRGLTRLCAESASNHDLAGGPRCGVRVPKQPARLRRDIPSHQPCEAHVTRKLVVASTCFVSC
jgi:hypothetical protein